MQLDQPTSPRATVEASGFRSEFGSLECCRAGSSDSSAATASGSGAVVSALFQVAVRWVRLSVLFHLARNRLPIAVVVVSGVLAIAGCGSTSKPINTSASKTASSYARSQLAWAACIRSHGVPNLPDPTFAAGGAQVNLQTPAGMLTSPAFAVAQKACAKLGLVGAGYVVSQERPPATGIAQWVAVARCMRVHGVPNFPDPARTMPPNPATYRARYSSVANMNGVIWAIPKSIDPQAPAVKQAATACGPNAAAVIAP